MKVVSYEGVVENGKIRLPPDALLPEKSKVYVVVPELIVKSDKPPVVVRVSSPRLKDPELSDLLELEVIRKTDDATN